MSFDYARAQATAERLLASFGARGAIRRQTPGSGPSYDPGPPVLTDHPATVAVTAYTAREIDGTRIRATDKKALVSSAGLPFEPTTSDKLLDASGQAYTIVNVEVLRPAETTVLYTLQVRR